MRSKESGWPMPPPAPSTVTLVCRAELVEKTRVWVDKRRVAERVNMTDERKCVGAGGTNITNEYVVGVPTRPPFSEARAELPTGHQLCNFAIMVASHLLNDGDAHWHLVLRTPKSRYILAFPNSRCIKSGNSQALMICSMQTCRLLRS